MGCPSSESGGNRTTAPLQLEMANCTISLSSIPRSRRRRPIHLPVPDDSPGRPRRLSRPSPTTLPAVPDDSPGRPRRLSRPSPTTLPAVPDDSPGRPRRLSRPSPTTLPAVPDDSPGRPRRLSRPLHAHRDDAQDDFLSLMHYRPPNERASTTTSSTTVEGGSRLRWPRKIVVRITVNVFYMVELVPLDEVDVEQFFFSYPRAGSKYSRDGLRFCPCSLLSSTRATLAIS